MAASWQTVRVFISSTFRDMHAERDHLVKFVFPALREKLEAYRVHLVDIDLRWGVTKEQADNDEALDVCLDQIDACRPFFIGILGERYGWVSTKLPERVANKYGWIRHHTGKSITELEIVYGVLQNLQMRRRAFFYFRDPYALLDVPEAIRSTVYCETEPELIAKLHDLKEWIRRSGFPLLDGYPAHWDANAYDRTSRSHGRLVGLKAFGERVRDQLWQAIQEELQLLKRVPVVSDVDSFAQEQDYHELFMESRLRVYVGREQINDILLAFANRNDLHPCLVTGPSGSGKSAALSRFVRDYQHKHSQTLVIPHFIGASPRSTNLRDMLRRFCQVFTTRFGFAEELPEEVAKLSVAFRKFVSKVPADTRVLLVIDALNQLDESDRAQELHWLPTEFPPQVKMIVSCTSDALAPTGRGQGERQPVLETLRRRKYCLVQLAALSDVEQRLIIGQVPSLSAKTLDELQTGLLLSNPAAENPLFLMVALEELRGFGSFEQLDSKIANFPHPQEQEPRWHQWFLDSQANARNLEALARASGDEVEATKWRGQLKRLDLIEPMLQTITPISDTVTVIFTQVIERLAEEFNPTLVETVLKLLASARRGLSEKEMQELVADLQAADDLFPLLRQLRPYLLSRAGVIDFYHHNLFKAVRERYLDSAEQRMQAHVRLAEYFNAKDYWLESIEEQQERAKTVPPTPRSTNVRKIDELPWQLLQAADWQRLEQLLTDLPYLEAKAEAGMVFDLNTDFSAAIASMPPDRPLLRILSLLEEALCRNTHFIARHPTTLFQCLWNSVHWDQISSTASPQQTLSSLSKHRVGDSIPRDNPLTRLVQSWLVKKRTSSPGAVWLRSLRPPYSPVAAAGTVLLYGHKGQVLCVDISDDLGLIATASEDGTIGLWSENSRRDPIFVCSHDRLIYCVSFIPKTRCVVTASADATVRLWDVEFGRELTRLVIPHGSIQTIAVSHDGTTLALANPDHAIEIWRIPECRRLTSLTADRRAIWSLSFSFDDRYLCSASLDGSIHIWKLPDGDEIARVSLSHPVRAAEFSPAGYDLAIGDEAGDLVIIDPLNDTTVFSQILDSPVYHIAWSPDGHRIAATTRSKQLGTVHVFDVVSEKEIARLSHDAGWFNGVKFVGHSEKVLLACSDGMAVLWEVAISNKDLISSAGPKLPIQCIAAANDGAFLVTGSDDGVILIWDPLSASPTRSIETRHGPVHAVHVSPDGTKVVAGCEDGWVVCVEINSGATKQLYFHRSRVLGVKWSLDGHYIVSGSSDRSVVGYDFVNHRDFLTFNTCKSYASSVAISDDNRFLAAGEGNYSPAIRVWDLKEGREVHVLKGHAYSVCDLAFTPDGAQLVSISIPAAQLFGSQRTSGETMVWNLADGSCSKKLEGMHDVVGLIRGRPAYPFVPACDQEEIAVHDVEKGTQVGWWPGGMYHPSTLPKSGVFAFALHRYLAVLKIEVF